MNMARAEVNTMPASAPVTKLSQLRAAYQAGDYVGALRIAARFPNLGEDRNAILTAWGAIQNPCMYAQMGRDVDALIAAGREALIQRYEL